jgi:hypothetical protein
MMNEATFFGWFIIGYMYHNHHFPEKGIAPTYPKIQWLRFDDDPSPRKLAKTATACHLAVMSYPKLRDRTYHKFSMSQCQIISKDGSWTAGLEH